MNGECVCQAPQILIFSNLYRHGAWGGGGGGGGGGLSHICLGNNEDIRCKISETRFILKDNLMFCYSSDMIIAKSGSPLAIVVLPTRCCGLLDCLFTAFYS